MYIDYILYNMLRVLYVRIIHNLGWQWSPPRAINYLIQMPGLGTKNLFWVVGHESLRDASKTI